MAQERCNLDKDEAEILRPPSPSSSSASAPQPAVPPPSTLFLIPPQKRPRQRAESPGAKRKEDEHPHVDATVTSGPEAPGTEHASSPSPVTRSVNRCLACQKRVGLTGFRCRCGDLFCPRHRYSDAHSCSFDYKAAGREEIARANPVIRAAKIIKI